MLKRILKTMGYAPRAPQKDKRMLAIRSGLGNQSRADALFTSNWNPNLVKNMQDRMLLVKRSRDLVCNTAVIRNASEVLSNNIVGTGIRPNPQTEDSEYNQAVRRAWDSLFVGHADLFGKQNFYSLQTTAFKSMFTSGECFIVRRRVNDDRPLATRLQIMQTEQLDSSRNGENVEEGIEYNIYGEPVAYYLFPRPPEGHFAFNQFLQSERIPAEDVIHLYDPENANYSRGVPWTQPIQTMMYQLNDVAKAEAQRRWVESCHVAFIKNTNPGADTGQFLGHDLKDENGNKIAGVTDSDGDVVAELSPGGIFHLQPYEDVVFNAPKSSGDFTQWTSTFLMLVSAGLRIPYVLLAGDFASINYSSYRGAQLEFRKTISSIQNNILYPNMCDKVYRWVLDELQLRGEIPYYDDNVSWTPPKIEFLDAEKDNRADALSVEYGFTTLEDEIMKRGRNPDDHLENIKQEREKLKKLGIRIPIASGVSSAQPVQNPIEEGNNPGENEPATGEDEPEEEENEVENQEDENEEEEE